MQKALTVIIVAVWVLSLDEIRKWIKEIGGSCVTIQLKIPLWFILVGLIGLLVIADSIR